MSTSKSCLEKLSDCLSAILACVILGECFIFGLTGGFFVCGTDVLLGITMWAVVLLIIARLRETSWKKDKTK